MLIDRRHVVALAILWLLAPGCSASPPSLPPRAARTAQRSAAPKPAAGETTVVVPSPVGPESWATFRNGNRQLGIAKTTLPAEPEVLWQFKTPDGLIGCAAIVGEQVYVPCLDGELLSIDRRTGKRQWSYRSIESTNPNDFASGFRSGTTVDSDTVYVGDEDGGLHAVDRRNGKKKWKFQSGANIAGAAALFVGDRRPGERDADRVRVIFGSHDNFLYCLNAAAGGLVWKFQTENRVNCSTAIEGNNTFIAGCDTKVRVIDIQNGKEVGEVPLGDGAYLIASPAVSGDMLYVGTHDGRVVAVDWRQKKVVWTYTDPNRPMEFRSSAAVTDEFVILGGYDKKLHCLDRKKGTEVWSFTTRKHVECSPVVVGDRVFFGSGDGNVYAVGLKDGKETWRYKTGRSIVASPAVGEKCLVIGTEGPNGTVYCFGAKEH